MDKTVARQFQYSIGKYSIISYVYYQSHWIRAIYNNPREGPARVKMQIATITNLYSCIVQIVNQKISCRNLLILGGTSKLQQYIHNNRYNDI